MLHIVEHPCIKAKLTILRDKNTPVAQFRECVQEITAFIAYEALKNLEVEEIEVETPIAAAVGHRLKGEVIFVPILRAGMGMLDGMLRLVPRAKVGFVGLERDHATKLPHEYYCKLPAARPNSAAVVVDPMLATGGSLAAAIDLLKRENFHHIIVVTIISSPEGRAFIESRYPDIKIYTGCLDSGLNENKYIVPGLGDAGDRIFGTL